MQKTWFKLCSILLVIVLVFQMLPMSSFAAEYNTQKSQSSGTVQAEDEDVRIVEEVTSKRTEFTKEYKLSNGLHMAAVYPSAVHYEEDGQWKDIDNTLVADNTAGVLTNTAGVWDISFPQQLTKDGRITVSKDGYTLSFGMDGELRSPSGYETMSIGSGTYAVSAAKTSLAQIQEVELVQDEDPLSPPVLDKLSTRLQYTGVYDSTNITYDLQSKQIKESIILERYSSTLRGYRYVLDVGQMVPVLAEDGHIDFYDAEQDQIVMVMPAPYLVDAANAYSGDVAVTLTGSGSEFTLTYLLPRQWLAEADRAWPVILDPVIEADTSVSNIKDQTVGERHIYSYTWGMIDCGYETGVGIKRFFLGYDNLPALTSSDVIVGASVALYKYETSGTTASVEVHKVNETWVSNGLKWSNMPTTNTVIEDFAVVREYGWYQWDVTDIVRGWYEGENTGMMFKTNDEVEQAKTDNYKQFLSSDYGVAASRPQLSIVFRNNNGLESYWDYTASSAGRAGTGYVNDYTGNLVWIHGDIGFGGTRMPVSVSHVYNANDSANNSFGMGYGWRTNFNQRVYQWNKNSNYYVWEDSDGTKHYFCYSSSNTYKDEDGLELTLTTNGSGASKYTITDKYGNRSCFDTNGRLTKQENNQATKSSITITYTTSTGLLISAITDGAGRVYSFTYSGGLLSRISYKGKGSTELSYVSFGYSGSQLTSVTDKDGKSCQYTYTTNNLLSSASDIDGYKLTYAYNTTRAGQPSRVSKVCEYSGSVAGGELAIEYAHNQTTFTDVDNNVQIMQFNNLGNTVSIQDDEGRAQFAQYATNESSESVKGNQLKLASKLQNTVGNVLQNSSFESGSAWGTIDSSVTSSIATNNIAYHGGNSLKMTRSAAGAASGVYSPAFSVPAGETYTFSAYVKTGSGSAYLALQGGKTVNSETLKAGSDWTRLEVSYTNNTASAQSVTARLMTTEAGATYMDCAQVEKAPTASRYNLIENGDFRYSGTWINGGSSGSTEKRTTTNTSAASELDANVYTIQGKYNQAKNVYQTVYTSGSAGDAYVLAGWAKGDAAPFNDAEHKENSKINLREFGLKAIFNNTDGTKDECAVVRFNPDADSSINWQYAAAPIVAKKDFNSITVQIVYNYNVNSVSFDGIQLYKEEFGSSYTYDEKGNVISVKDLQGQTTNYEYTNNDLTKAILPTGAKMTYTYDAYHNVKTATTDMGIASSFNYDAYGNNTSVSILSGSQSITATASYTADGNRLASMSDAAGNVTRYSYNENTNVLEWVQYPEDTEATRTNYTYDALYRLTSATATGNTGTALTASYTYQDDLLTSVQTNSTTYSFAYGDFALRSSIAIGDRTLANYSYTSRNNFLSSLDYGNGDSVDYIYDKKGRLIGQTYEDGSTVTYQYDNSGALASVTDSATGVTTTYYYDFTDRLLQYLETGENFVHSVHYGYDTINNLTQLVEVINGVEHTTSYEYDKDNRVTSVTGGNSSRAYTYDAYSRLSQRLTKHNGNTVLTESLTYRTPSAAATTSQVATLRQQAGGYDKTYTYGYDNNGNIVSIGDGTNTTTYVYDSANQLVRENNQSAGKTWVYTYDNAGNITGKKEYAYTTGAVGALEKENTYTYGDSSWGDLLTGYNGQEFTVDEIGNILNDGVWSYIWQHGRQLAQMQTSGDDFETIIDFKYSADGLRTEKVVTTRTNGFTQHIVTYRYVYNGSQLVQETVTTETIEDDTTTTEVLYYAYDASGSPLSVTITDNTGTESTYYYATNLQGDVSAIFTPDGNAVVEYTYDAWGNPLAVTGTLSDTLGETNSLRYRDYVYDNETGYYYLQSRYYNPELGRFINADVYASTGQGLIGNNMFAYCNNCPVLFADASGTRVVACLDVDGGGGGGRRIPLSAEEWNAIYTAKYIGESAEILDSGIRIGLEPCTKQLAIAIDAIGINGVSDIIANEVCERFKEANGRNILFTNACVANEIREHIGAYFFSIGVEFYPNATAVAGMLYEKSFRRDSIYSHVYIIDIFEEDLNDWKQNLLYGYDYQIRKEYRG